MPGLGLTASLLLLAACGKSAAGAPEARLGEPFPLRVGESASVEGVDLAIELVEVASDSRCPKDVTCIQAGEAVVRLALRSAGGESAELELAVPPGGSSRAESFGDFRIAIVKLDPEKESAKRIDPASYVATVTVRRS